MLAKITLGAYKLRNGLTATVERIEKIKCVLWGGKPGFTYAAWGTDENGVLHMWDCDTGSCAPSSQGQLKREDIVERL